MSSLTRYGLTSCRGGFGTRAGWSDCSGVGGLTHRIDGTITWRPRAWDADSVVDELNLLLAAGRVNPVSRAIMLDKFRQVQEVDSLWEAVQVAQELMIATAEFHATNNHRLTTNLRPTKVETESTNHGYKAIVVLYMYGGADTFNVIMPYGDCGDFDLYDNYRTARSNLATNLTDMLPVNVTPVGSQPCGTFGLHRQLTTLQQLYNDGDAVLLANIGTLIEPVTKAQYYNPRANPVRLPPSLYSHNSQQEQSMTVHAQELSAHGVIGRMMTSLTTQEEKYKVGLYSVGRETPILEGVLPPTILDSNDGVVRYVAYNRLAEQISEMTKFEGSSVYAETWNQELQASLRRTESIGNSLKEVDLTQDWSGASGFTRELQQVARLIATREQAETDREAFFVSMGGFDMHFEVHNSLDMRMRAINDALNLFVAEMKGLDVWENVVLVTSSDFARTLTSNGRGSDHAWGGNHFLIGGQVSGGRMLGKYPAMLTDQGEQILTRGRVIPTMGWEGIWTGLAQWFGVAEERMGVVMPNRNNFPPDMILTEDEIFMPPSPPSPPMPPQNPPPPAPPALPPVVLRDDVTVSVVGAVCTDASACEIGYSLAATPRIQGLSP
eukprot:3446729-Pleurochrysis_carterae.AAC.1